MKQKKPESASEMMVMIKIKLALINFIFPGIFLFYSEFLNAVFNNTLDEQGASFSRRLAFTFKPTVVALFVVFAIALFIIVLSYLKPMFQWMKDQTYEGERYRKARTAIRIPWTVLIFQLAHGRSVRQPIMPSTDFRRKAEFLMCSACPEAGGGSDSRDVHRNSHQFDADPGKTAP